MAAAPRLKLADKQEIYKKLLSGLKKRYPVSTKLPDLPVLETMLFAVCLENATVKDADAAFKRLLTSFHDLNEIRVSSIDEIEVVFAGMSTPDWRASRIRGILNYVFESNYSFEYEGLKRKTLELATKQLAKIKELTPFVRDYTLHAALGAHLIPLDDSQHLALEFVDLQAEAGGQEHTAESLRPLVRKAEGPEFCSLLREFALDPKLRPNFMIVRQAPPLEGATLPAAIVRFERLLKGEPIKYEGGTPKKTNADKKSSEKKAPEKVEKTEKKPAAPVAPVVAKGAKKPAVEVAKKTVNGSAKPAPPAAKPPKPAAKSNGGDKPKSKPAPSVAKKDNQKKPVAASKPAKPGAKPVPKPLKKHPAKSGK